MSAAPATGGDLPVEIGPPVGRAEERAAALVLAEAFLDDPVWTAIGPRRRAHRRIANRASYAGIVIACRRHGARIRIARLDGRVVGCSIAFVPGSWPLPEAAALWEIGWVLVAGPGPLIRGMRDDRAMRDHHVAHPHMYLWFLGIDPTLHSRGAGRALLAELHPEAEELGVPTYLETGTESNVGFYERQGYEVIGEIAMPSGPTMWRMERP